MNLNLRKSVLLVGALASLGLSYTTEALATSPNFAVNSVQQSKKVTGNVSDAEGPIIGASVVEKGNAGNGTVTDLDGNFYIEREAWRYYCNYLYRLPEAGNCCR